MEKIITSIAAGTAPDVIRFGYAPRFASKGMLIPLDEYIHGPDGVDLMNILTELSMPATYGMVKFMAYLTISFLMAFFTT